MRHLKMLSVLFILLLSIVILNTTSNAASSPYSVPTNIKNNWNNIFGAKTYDMRDGKRIVYDVYYNKYNEINGGYRIVNRDFGKGSQPYLNFRGWAINMGRQHHTSSNNETYIVAQKDGTGETKIYSTLKLNLSATEDLEYNKDKSTSTTVWNRCSNSDRNKSNVPTESDGCNMEYDGVGFDAYLPLNELFPSATEGSSWRLYIVKEVGGHIVYTPLILPFEFDKRSHNGGEISLSSGVNANKLSMTSGVVIRRTAPRSDETSSARGYFQQNRTYTRVSSNEAQTAIWYGVRSPHDNNATRWASTAYWTFGGDQAILKFVPDDKPPVHIADSVTGHRYRTGSSNYTYWAQPNDELTISLRQQDVDSGNKYQYMRLMLNDTIMVRSRHDFTQSSTTEKSNQVTSSHVSVNAAKRTENTSYGKVQWTVEPKTHDHIYDIQYYYQDRANNTLGYNNTGDKIRVDGLDPSHIQHTITGFSYQKGEDYWVKPNDVVGIALRGQDEDSLLNRTYLRLNGSGKDARGVYYFNNSTYDYFYPDTGINISSGSKTYESPGLWAKEVTYKASASTHGDTYNIQYYYQDNVQNTLGYSNTGMRLRVDGVAPTHLSNSLTGYRYKNGEDYWVKTGDQVTVTLRQNDEHSGNESQFLRFYGSGVDDRSFHTYSGTTTNFGVLSSYNSPHINTDSANRTENTTNGTIQWNVTPKTHGHTYDIQYYYRDNVSNNTGYQNTGMRLRTDDEAPLVQFRNKDDNADFTSRDWSNTQIDVRLKYSDAHSGYKESRYAWTQSSNTPKESEWSSWTTNSNYVVTKDRAGEWYLHVQAKDNVGNILTTVQGMYKLNSPPIADFGYPIPLYEGDELFLENLSTDPEGHDMTAEWTVTFPSGSVQNYTSWDVPISRAESGVYTVHLKVTDVYGGTDQITKQVNVLPLEIEGKVGHTIEWEEIHGRNGDPPEYFYSGEKFLTSAVVTDYPIDRVTVKFSGEQVTGNILTITETLEPNVFPTFTGEVFDESMSEPTTKLIDGPVYFLFTAYFSNGVVKQDLVEVYIYGDVIEKLQLYRSN